MNTNFLSTKLVPNFTVKELINTSSSYLDENIQFASENIREIEQLALFAQQVRTILNTPMTITSGYRSYNVNKSVGGSNTSDHMLCKAIDFVTPKMKLQTAFDKLRNSDILFGQLILEKNQWLHISIGYKRDVLVYDGKSYVKAK